jgi:hypothetical protein
MDFRTAHTLFQALHGDRCAFGYGGSFPDEHTARLIDLGSAVLEAQGSNLVDRARLGYVMVEAYQNIVRHSAEIPPFLAAGAGKSLFLLRCHAAGQEVMAMNPVTREQAKRLEHALGTLQDKSAAQLKELFLSGLQRSAGSGNRGAGLGLIEMARRSGRVPGWTLCELDAAHDLFVIAMAIGREKPDPGAAVRAACEFHDILAPSGVRFFHLGLRPPGVEEVLLRLVEREGGGEEGSLRRSNHARALLAVMGLADKSKEGVGQLLVFAELEGRYSVLFGALMAENEAAALGGHVREVATWSGMQLQRAYQEGVLGRPSSAVPLGLIELAQISPEPLTFGEMPAGDATLALVKALV